MCDQIYLYAADSSRKLVSESNVTSENNQMIDKSSALINDNLNQFETPSCITPDNNKVIDKSNVLINDNPNQFETPSCIAPDSNKMIDKSIVLINDNSNQFETPACITPDNNKMIDKAIVLFNDNPNQFETPACITPDNNHGFDKPRLFAADSSKKLESSFDIMPENIRKRRSISVKEKLDILNMVDSGHKLSVVAREFGISSSTASTIVKERHKIKMLSNHYNIDPDRKRMRLGIYRDVDEAVHVWFRQMRMKNIPINGPMLQQKAREFAIQLGHQNFEGSSGWLFRFRERHGLTVKTMRDNDESNIYNCSGVGMTDDEIVASVSQNQYNPLNFFEKDSGKDKINKSNKKDKVNSNDNSNSCNNNNSNIIINTIKPDIPENYFVPEIELTDYEPTVTFSEAVSLSEKLTLFLKDHDAPTDILQSINAVNKFLDKDLREQMKQRKITDYFKA